MPLSTGCNHVTIVTKDLDRFVEFYSRIFDAEVRVDELEGDVRHVMIDIGGGFCLHPFELPEIGDHAKGLPNIFQRGHIDHFALDFQDADGFEEARIRLVKAGSTSGQVRDFGVIKILTFTDPDGMECEIALWKEGKPLTMAESTVEAYEAA